MSRWKLSDVLNLIEDLSATASSGRIPRGETAPGATQALAAAASRK